MRGLPPDDFFLGPGFFAPDEPLRDREAGRFFLEPGGFFFFEPEDTFFDEDDFFAEDRLGVFFRPRLDDFLFLEPPLPPLAPDDCAATSSGVGASGDLQAMSLATEFVAWVSRLSGS